MKGSKNILIIILLAAAVLLAGAAAFVYRSTHSAAPASSRQVNIYQNGALAATGRLGQKEEIVIRGSSGEENVIAFHDDGVYMKHSSCANQLCVSQGEVTLTNFSTRFYQNRIICLPNRVTVELVLEDSEREGLPDV